MSQKGRGKFDAESTVALGDGRGGPSVNPCRQKPGAMAVLVISGKRDRRRVACVMGYASTPCDRRYTVRKPLPGTNPSSITQPRRSWQTCDRSLPLGGSGGVPCDLRMPAVGLLTYEGSLEPPTP